MIFRKKLQINERIEGLEEKYSAQVKLSAELISRIQALESDIRDLSFDVTNLESAMKVKRAFSNEKA